MDDNGEPYAQKNVDILTQEYYLQSNLSMQMLIADEIDSINENNGESVFFEVEDIDDIVQSEDKDGYYSLSAIKNNFDTLIVPLHRRVYIDAERAKEIFTELFLENELFINEVKKVYLEDNWVTTKENPLFWRMFLTTSSNFKEYKSSASDDEVMRSTYINSSYPHFI